jgi:Fuc2NAc and GlcNAc transferase
MLAGLVVAIAAGVVSLLVAWLIYRHASRLGVVQDPNERSSHTRPTPSGGGVGIVLGGTLGAAAAVWSLPGYAFVVAVLALTMGAIGFIDDRRHIPASARLFVQTVLAGAMVWTLQPSSLVDAVGVPLPFELAVVAIVVAAVYWINSFNFMDGIDGLAGAQAIFMLGASIFLVLHTTSSGFSPLLIWVAAVAAATLGFLVLNWPPARIFMGDAGSTYLGFMIAFAALSTIAAGWLDIFQWLILGALFLADATVTLIRRALRREPLMQAHRLHAYQHLSRRWHGHQPVTILYIGINVLWLLPWAWAAGNLPGFGLPAAAAAYLPVLLFVAWAGAGAPEAKA